MSLPAIQWRQVKGFPDYSVSNTGLIRSHKRPGTHPAGFIIGQPIDQREGYRKVALFKNGRSTKKRVHSLVLSAFRRPRKPCEVARHLDGNKTNNFVENLRWGSQAENVVDKARHGTNLKGERHPGVKLNRAKVFAIRRLHPGLSLRRIAQLFGVCKSTVQAIVTGKIWAHLEV